MLNAIKRFVSVSGSKLVHCIDNYTMITPLHSSRSHSTHSTWPTLNLECYKRSVLPDNADTRGFGVVCVNLSAASFRIGGAWQDSIRSGSSRILVSDDRIEQVCYDERLCVRLVFISENHRIHHTHILSHHTAFFRQFFQLYCFLALGAKRCT